MKITRCEVFQLDLPYRGGVYRLSGGREFTSFDGTFVRLVTDSGHEGWGESTPFGSTYIAAHAQGTRAALELLGRAVIGLDPRETDRLNQAMDQALVGHLDAKAAIDIAAWDLFGKAVGMPVCALLGGSQEQPMPRISSIHLGEPQEMAARVQAHRAQGYRGHSIKIGTAERDGGPDADAAKILACLGDRQPGEFFLVDCNGGLSVEHARRLLKLLPDSADFVLEAPCGTWAETKLLRQGCAVPLILDELATDEASVISLIQDGLADGVGLKITKAGGLTRGRRVRDICQAAGLSMSVQDTVGSALSFAAICHLGATVQPQLLSCVLDTRDMVTQLAGDFQPRISGGGDVLPPLTPGLGFAPGEALAEAKPVAVYS